MQIGAMASRARRSRRGTAYQRFELISAGSALEFKYGHDGKTAKSLTEPSIRPNRTAAHPIISVKRAAILGRVRRGSIRADIGFLDDARPLDGLRFHERAEFLGRVANRVRAPVDAKMMWRMSLRRSRFQAK
jgi:hypothetical protein